MFGRILSTLGTLLAMQEAMGSAMKFDYFETATVSRGIYPPVNLFQEGENTVLTAEVPGVHSLTLGSPVMKALGFLFQC